MVGCFLLMGTPPPPQGGVGPTMGWLAGGCGAKTGTGQHQSIFVGRFDSSQSSDSDDSVDHVLMPSSDEVVIEHMTLSDNLSVVHKSGYNWSPFRYKHGT